MRNCARVLSRACACLLSASAMIAAAQPARADVLTINAIGTVGTSCSIAASSPFGTPNLSSDGSVGAQATVNCNTGFKVNALSAYGAIKTGSAATANFTDALPYNFTLSIPLETGGPASAACASSA